MGEEGDEAGVFQGFPVTPLSLSIPSRCTPPELGSLLVGGKSDNSLLPGTDSDSAGE